MINLLSVCVQNKETGAAAVDVEMEINRKKCMELLLIRDHSSARLVHM